VLLRLLDADGTVLAEGGARIAEVEHPVRALRLEARQAPPDAVVAWRAEWRDPAGALLDAETLLASTGADLGPLLDLPPARLAGTVEADGDGGVLVLRHAGGPLAAGLRLLDARPAAAPGWAVLGNDPRPLLPGEERRLRLAWRGVPDGAPRPVLLDGWNVEPVRIAEPLAAGTDR
jgi:hypothetical protein